MANTKTTANQCMNCGAPIEAGGFFCKKCQAGETPESKQDGWKGSRFTGEAKKKRQQQLLMEDLKVWGKRLAILLVLGGVGWGGYAMFGNTIRERLNQAQNATAPKEKYDPTKDAATSEDDSQSGEKNGSRAFAPKEPAKPGPRDATTTGE